MSSNYTGVAANFNSGVAVQITVPSDGDNGAAASVDAAFDALADGQEFFRQNALFGAIFGLGIAGNTTMDGVSAADGCNLVGSVYTATRDLSFKNLTINAGITLKMAGFRLYVNGVLTGTATSIISCDGAAGSAQAAGVGGAGGNSGGHGGILGAAAGSDGGAGGGVGGVGTNITLNNSIAAFQGAPDGQGGAGGSGNGGFAGGTSTVNAPASTAGSPQAPPSLWTGMLFGASGVTVGQGGAGGGGGGGAGATNGGGGGGGGGGVLLVCAYKTSLAAGFTFSAKGGDGGAGTGAGAAASGPGGGGAGGAIVIVWHLTVASSTAPGSCTLNVNGGNAGTGGNGGASAGNVGTVALLQQV